MYVSTIVSNFLVWEPFFHTGGPENMLYFLSTEGKLPEEVDS